MKGFIVNSTYRFENGKPQVYLFGRLENGESFLSIHPYLPYLFVRAADMPKVREREWEIEGRNGKEKVSYSEEFSPFKTKDGSEVIKIILTIPGHVALFRDLLEEQKILTFEADIPFDRRFLIDHDVTTFIDIRGNFEKGKEVNRVYKNPEFFPADEFPSELKIFSFDIETDPKASTVYSIGISCESYKKVLIVSEKKLNHAISFKTEKEMLVEFRTLILRMDPDIVLNHYVIDFDLKVLKDRFDANTIPFSFGRIPGETRLKIEQGWGRSSSANVVGRVVLDSIQLLKQFRVKLNDGYSLNSAAKEILGDSKLIEGDDRVQEITRLYKEDPQKLVDYNLKDAELPLRILEKKNLIRLSMFMSSLTGLAMDRNKGKIASFDCIYQKLIRKKGVVSPSVKYVSKEEDLTGGFVAKSAPGLYDCAIIFDFRSLYPSLEWTFGIDPLTFIGKDEKAKSTPKVVVLSNGAMFRNDEETLLGDQIIKPLIEKRLQAKREQDEIKSEGIKVLLNSTSFGIFANPGCRWYNLDFANAITLTGQHIGHVVEKEMVRHCTEDLKLKGAIVYYRDTDSFFLHTGLSNYEKAQTLGPKIAEHINIFLENHIMEHYFRKSHLFLDYKRTAKKFFMPKGKMRGKESEKESTGGVKKRYCMLYEGKGKEILEFVGMEYVHSDVTDLAKEFQYNLFWKLFHGENTQSFTKEFIAQLKNGEFDEKLVYTKNMSKDERDYTKTTPPQVKVARILKEKGMTVPNPIRYVMTIDGPWPANLDIENLDYNHYVEKQILPLAEDIDMDVSAFLPPKKKAKKEDKKQTSLAHY